MISFKKYIGKKKGKCEILNILGPSLDKQDIPEVVYGKFPLVDILVDGEWETVICMRGIYYDGIDPKKQSILPRETIFEPGYGIIYPEISFTTKELALQFLSSMKIISRKDWDLMNEYGHAALCGDRTFRCYDHV